MSFSSSTTDATMPSPKQDIQAKESVEDTASQIRPFQRYILAVVVSLAAFLISLNASIISVAVPTITTYFHSVDDIGWYGTVYLLGDCCMQPLSGKIYQNCSLKWTFICFLSTFTIGSIICGAATSSDMLIVGRAIAGIGGSGITNGAMSIISVTTPLAKRPVIISGLMAAFGLGMVVGPLLGGVITQHASWRWCFFTTTIAAGFIIFVLVISKIPDRASKKKITAFGLLRKLDLVGFAVFAPSCIMLLLAVYFGGSAIYPWNSSHVIGLFCGFGGGLVAFVVWSWYKGEEAMIPLSFFTNRIVVASCLTGFFQMGSNIIVAFYLAIYFQAVKGAAPSAAGVMILPLILAQVVGAGVAGVFTQRLGYYMPPGLAGCVLSLVGSALLITLTPSTSEGVWIGYQIIGGAGRGLITQAPLMAAQAQLPTTNTDVGTALIFFTQFLGAALFVSFGQTVFSSSLLASVRSRLPNIDPELIMAAGATGYRKVFASDEATVEVLRDCYNLAVTRTFVLATAAAAVSLVACFGIGWISIKGKKKDDVEGNDAARSEDVQGAGDKPVVEKVDVDQNGNETAMSKEIMDVGPMAATTRPSLFDDGVESDWSLSHERASGCGKDEKIDIFA